MARGLGLRLSHYTVNVRSSNVQDGTFKIYVCPFEAKDFSSPHARYRGDEKRRPHRLDSFKFVKYGRDLGRFKNGRVCRLSPYSSHIRDRIRWMQFVTHPMAKCRTEDFTYFCLCSVRPINRLQPAFDSHR